MEREHEREEKQMAFDTVQLIVSDYFKLRIIIKTLCNSYTRRTRLFGVY